ncbi:MAG: acetolactate decarboxylase [Clostridiales bacterium]|nr:acetolactate decarboxylase [Clostridiales bacterium]
MDKNCMYQVSTLQALALGYTRSVVRTDELLSHGNTGLGTFEDVNGEMIVVDRHCYQAAEEGSITEMPPDIGVPFASVANLQGDRIFTLSEIPDIEHLKMKLNLKIEEDFGLNSMHIAKIEGDFERVDARSESAYRSHHVELKDILGKTQKSFCFKQIRGTMVCIYYPDYMDGINAPGWHLHFISEDRKWGGHVFDLQMKRGEVHLDKINRIEIQLPSEPAFDTYSLKEASQKDIKEVEQSK